jgi:hypothetical protein
MSQAPAPECCPPFDPAPWDEQELQWSARPFVRDHVRCLFYIPLNFGGVMVRNLARIEAAGVADPAMVVLADAGSPWGLDVYLGTTGDVPGAAMTHLSGTFLAKVFEGPYRREGAWRREMAAFVAARGKTARRVFAYYTSCPKCATKHGKNYVVLLAEV